MDEGADGKDGYCERYEISNGEERDLMGTKLASRFVKFE